MISTLKNTRVISFGVLRTRKYYTKDMVSSPIEKEISEIKKDNWAVCKYVDKYMAYPTTYIFEKKIREDLDIINQKLNRCIENQFYYTVISNVASFWIATFFYTFR